MSSALLLKVYDQATTEPDAEGLARISSAVQPRPCPGLPLRPAPAAGGEGGKAQTPKREAHPFRPTFPGWQGLRAAPPPVPGVLWVGTTRTPPLAGPPRPPRARSPPAPGPPPRAPAAADAARCARSHGSTSFRRSKSETRRRAIARTRPAGSWGPAPRAFPALRPPPHGPPRPSTPPPAPRGARPSFLSPASPRRPLSVLPRPGPGSPERRLLQAYPEPWSLEPGTPGRGWGRGRQGTRGGDQAHPARTLHVRPSGGGQVSGRI